MDFKQILKDVAAKIDWKKLLAGAYNAVRPAIAKKVNETASKWDDVAFDMADKLVARLLEGALEGEKSSVELIAENK